MLVRPPHPALRPFIKLLWAADEVEGRTGREWVVPTGSMHVVIRLSDDPLRVYEDVDDPVGRSFARAVVGGVRLTSYVRDVSSPLRTVGAQLHPGAAPLMLGVPADELAHSHTALEDLWGARAVGRVREQLLETASLEERLHIFEALLISRRPPVRGIHPLVAHALIRFAEDANVGKVVRESGYSHRTFIAQFRQEVGLPPKSYTRIGRLQKVLRSWAAMPQPSWAHLAAEAGYSDQAHLTREFREIVGVPPREYRKLAADSTHHVPVPAKGKFSSRR